MKLTARPFTRAGLGLCMLAVPHVFALAQDLADPTRPPASVQAGMTGTGAAPAAAEPALQSVLISPSRKEAIIDGQVVKLGEKYGEARVVGISANEVVLRNGQNVQTLRLFPNVEKRAVSDRGTAR